jgi:hypothetical protein
VVTLRSRTTGVVTGIALIAYLAGCAGPAVPESVAPPSSTSAAPTVFDVGRDFSFAANPNGPWSYGYTRGSRLAFADIARSTVADPSTPVGFWHPGPGSDGYYPYVAASPGSGTAHDATDSWEVRPGEVALEASASGQFAVIEFSVPRAGTYDIAADFAGIHKGLSTTDVHVLLNDESLFTAEISGYGGDPAYFPRQGASPTASYRGIRALHAGDVLIFAVGYGVNHTHSYDTTGLIATLRASV